MKSDRGSTGSAESSATDNELMPKGELSSSGDLLPRRRAQFKQVAVVAFFIIGLIVCVTSLICILLLPTFVTNQISKVSRAPDMSIFDCPNIILYDQLTILKCTFRDLYSKTTLYYSSAGRNLMFLCTLKFGFST